MNLDFDMFPSMEMGYLLVPEPPEVLNNFPELRARCSAAIYMASHVGGKSTKSVISDEVHKAAYIRAALSEFVGMEDVTKPLVEKKYEHEISIDKCNNPLFHIMKLLRNYNIHVGSSVCSEVTFSVIAVGEEHEINADVIDNLSVELLKALRAGKHYTDTEMDRMVQYFTLEQNKLGVCNLLLKGILLYAELLLEFLIG
jgi:hypothetical protein